jgi:hypothetical protein
MHYRGPSSRSTLAPEDVVASQKTRSSGALPVEVFENEHDVPWQVCLH